jgi:hypothetical protein
MNDRSKITVRQIGGGYFVATFCVRNSVRTGIAPSRGEAISRADTRLTINKPSFKQ